MLDRLFGALLLLVTGAVFFVAGVDALVRHPGWYGAWLLGSYAVTAAAAVRSIARDRLS